MYRKEDLEREALEYISKLEELLACEEFDFNVNPDRVPKKRGVYVILIRGMKNQSTSAELIKEIFIKGFYIITKREEASLGQRWVDYIIYSQRRKCPNISWKTAVSDLR